MQWFEAKEGWDAAQGKWDDQKTGGKPDGRETSPAEQAGISGGRNAVPAAYLGPKSRRLWDLQGKTGKKKGRILGKSC